MKNKATAPIAAAIAIIFDPDELDEELTTVAVLGWDVGWTDGNMLGWPDGCSVGDFVGILGFELGLLDGWPDGIKVGLFRGCTDGFEVGWQLGKLVG